MGRLEVIYGCMFSGKTTELIRRLTAARDSGLTVLAIKPRSDYRSGTARLATHTGAFLEAMDVEDASQIPDAPRVVGIDEAHFLGHELVPVCRRLLALGRRVVVAGIHLDHMGRSFAPFPDLLSIADESLQLFAPCARCGRPAIHSRRKTPGVSQERILVGGADLYEPLCTGCFGPIPG